MAFLRESKRPISRRYRSQSVESKKYGMQCAHRDEKAMAFPQGANAGVVIVVTIIIILAVGAVLIVPYSPSISGTFVIQTNPSNPYQISIFLVSASYAKQPIIRGYFANGTLSLPVTPAASGSFTLTITISYQEVTLTSQIYNQQSAGTYGFQIGWFQRQESTGVPYVVTVSVSGSTIGPQSISFAIYPT